MGDECCKNICRSYLDHEAATSISGGSSQANVEELSKLLQYMQLKDLFDKQKRYRIEQFLDLLAEPNEVLKSEEYFEQ